MLRELLTDGTGPLFTANSRGPTLAQIISDAQAALSAAPLDQRLSRGPRHPSQRAHERRCEE
jgi:hypothetical protein